MHARAHKYTGDLWGVENRDRLFDIPEAAIKVCVCLRGARARESESERECVFPTGALPCASCESRADGGCCAPRAKL